jgi:hypothetical protein
VAGCGADFIGRGRVTGNQRCDAFPRDPRPNRREPRTAHIVFQPNAPKSDKKPGGGILGHLPGL